jgi:hypothetical protein
MQQKQDKIKISKVILCSNGIVIVCNQKGEQLCDYQGSFKSAKTKLINGVAFGKISLLDAKFYIGQFPDKFIKISSESFFCELWEK